MAHGFLGYEPVSGESPIVNFVKKKLKDGLKGLWGKFQKTSGALTKSSGGQVNYSANPQGVTVQDVTNRGPAAKKMFSNATAGLLGAGTGSITKQEPTAIPGGTGGGIAKRPGGTFTDVPGVSSGSGLNADTFFKQATTGVGSSGEYLTNAQRREAFIKSRQESAKTATSAASTLPISPDSGADIVAAVNRNTQIMLSLVDAVKEQTKTEVQLSDRQEQSTEKLMLRAAAREEEKYLEQGNDLSGFMTPENFAKRKKNEKKKEENDKGSKLKEFFRGPNPYKQPEGCGCSPILGGPPGGGFGGIGVPDFVDQKRKTMGRPSRLGGGASAMRRGGGARGLTRIATKVGGKGAGKAVAKGLGKGLLKKIPGVGVLAGGAFAAERAMKGDWLGAGGELLSGIAGIIPGIGTGISAGIDAGLAARDAGLTPFANGGIVTNPVAGLVGEAGNEGIFPLEGTRGKKTFKLFGEGIFEAQKDNDKDFAKLQAMGLKQYYEREGGFKKMGEGLKDFFAGLGNAFGRIFNSLTGGTANAGTLDGAADYLGDGIGGSTAERNAAAFLSTLEGGAGQTAADTFQVMLNRTANAKSGGSMKAYGTSLFDQITAREQFSPFSAAIYGGSADSAAARKYGPITKALGNTPEERKRRLLEIAGQPDGIAALQKLFKAGSASAAAKVLADFESGGEMSKSSAQFVGGAMSFRGYHTEGSRRRAEGGNYIFGAAQGTKAASLNAVSAAPENVLSTGKLPKLPKTGTMHGQAYGANRRGGRKHAGVDFDISGNEKFFSRIGGTVVKVGYDPSGYGNYVDIYNEEMKVTERIAEGAKVLVKQGQKVSAGTPIVQGETQTGVIHYEIRKGQGGYGFSGTLNPLNFLSSVSSKNQDTASTGSGSPSSGRVSRAGQRGGGSSPGSLQASAASPNTGTPMLAASQQVAMNTMGLTTQGGAPTIINNYYGGGNQQGAVNGNGVTPGIGMEQTGTAIFQDLRIRALA